MYPGHTFDDLVGLVVGHNVGMGKGHLMRARKRDRMYVGWCSDEHCQFRLNCRLNKDGELKITVFMPHNCTAGSARKWQIPTKVIKKLTNTVSGFVPSRGRAGGNARQLQEMVSQDCGLNLKSGQTYRILQQKQGGCEAHFAYYRIIKSYMQAAQCGDPEGLYARWSWCRSSAARSSSGGRSAPPPAPSVRYSTSLAWWQSTRHT